MGINAKSKECGHVFAAVVDPMKNRASRILVQLPQLIAGPRVNDLLFQLKNLFSSKTSGTGSQYLRNLICAESNIRKL